MKKESIIGIILIGIIMFGFSWYQSKQFEKQQAAVQAYNDSLALAQRVQWIIDSTARAQAIERGEIVEDVLTEATEAATVVNTYKDSSLTYAANAEGSIVKLENDVLAVEISTKGAQPYSVNVKNYKAYGQDQLILVRPGSSDYNVSLYAGEAINTKDFNFQIAEQTSESVSLRLVFADGGYIQQKFTLPQGSYMLYNELSFSGMGNIIPRNVGSFDIDWSLVIPRLEKGWKNEKQYSKLDIQFPGEGKPEVVANGRDASKTYNTRIDWFNFHQQFFSSILTATSGGFTSGAFNVKFGQENDAEGNLMYCSASLGNELSLKNGDAAYNYEFYFGPNNYRILRSYDRNYDKVITIGGRLIGLITRFVIIPVFELLSKFIKSYGIIILLLTLLIKLVISPLTIKSYMSSAKMNAIKPEVDKINAKYPKAATDQKEAMKKQQATMELYKRAGINPAGGCLPMLLQFPILWAMFRFFPASIELRQQSFLWADDLSAYDSILNFGFSIFGMDHLSLFALLMALSMFIYSRMTMPATTDPQMAPMRFMSVWLMPIMMFFICNSLSAGLSYYYLLSNLITMAQTFVIKKWIVKPEKLLAEIEANKNKPLKKSKWQERLEQAQKMAEAQQKAAAKRR